MFDLPNLWEYWSHGLREHAALSEAGRNVRTRFPCRRHGPASAGQAAGRIQLEPLMCVKAIFRVIEGGVEGFQVCSRIAWAQAPRVLFAVCLGYGRPRTQLTTFVMSFPIPPPGSPVLEHLDQLACLGAPRFPSCAGSCSAVFFQAHSHPDHVLGVASQRPRHAPCSRGHQFCGKMSCHGVTMKSWMASGRISRRGEMK